MDAAGRANRSQFLHSASSGPSETRRLASTGARCTRNLRRRAASRSRRGQKRPLAAKDRKSTRLNSSHLGISYAVFCLKKKTERRRGLLVRLVESRLLVGVHH